jgi:hypothetical protein
MSIDLLDFTDSSPSARAEEFTDASSARRHCSSSVKDEPMIQIYEVLEKEPITTAKVSDFLAQVPLSPEAFSSRSGIPRATRETSFTATATLK